MALITDALRDAIWREAEPAAGEAFRKLETDHGEAFADAYRLQLLTQKRLQEQMDDIDQARSQSGTKKIIA